MLASTAGLCSKNHGCGVPSNKWHCGTITSLTCFAAASAFSCCLLETRACRASATRRHLLRAFALACCALCVQHACNDNGCTCKRTIKHANTKEALVRASILCSCCEPVLLSRHSRQPPFLLQRLSDVLLVLHLHMRAWLNQQCLLLVEVLLAISGPSHEPQDIYAKCILHECAGCPHAPQLCT